MCRHHRPILVAPSRVHKWCAKSVHRRRNRHSQLCEGLRVRRRELIAGHELSTRICQLDSANFLVSLYESRISVHRPQRLHSVHFVECYWYCENSNATIHVFVYWTVLYCTGLFTYCTCLTPFAVIANYCPIAPTGTAYSNPPTVYTRTLGSTLIYSCTLGYSGPPNTTCNEYNYTAGYWTNMTTTCSRVPFLVLIHRDLP